MNLHEIVSELADIEESEDAGDYSVVVDHAPNIDESLCKILTVEVDLTNQRVILHLDCA